MDRTRRNQETIVEPMVIDYWNRVLRKTTYVIDDELCFFLLFLLNNNNLTQIKITIRVCECVAVVDCGLGLYQNVTFLYEVHASIEWKRQIELSHHNVHWNKCQIHFFDMLAYFPCTLSHIQSYENKPSESNFGYNRFETVFEEQDTRETSNSSVSVVRFCTSVHFEQMLTEGAGLEVLWQFWHFTDEADVNWIW